MSDIPPHKKLLLVLTLLVMLSACESQVVSTPTPAAIPTQTVTATVENTAEATAVLPPTVAPCTDTTGKIVVEEIQSNLLKERISTKIYLPPCYASAKNPYPVLYLLHGLSNNNDQWQRMGVFSTMDELLADNSILPFVIVLPNESNTNKYSSNSKYGEALINEVIPYLEKEYNICSKRSCRAIGGLSRGGNWAVHLAVTYPQLFFAVGAHSTPLFYGEITNITDSVEKAGSPLALPTFFVDVGDRDEDRQDVYAFVTALKSLEVPYVFTEYLGYHDEVYWSAHLRDYLLWYSSQFATSVTD